MTQKYPCQPLRRKSNSPHEKPGKNTCINTDIYHYINALNAFDLLRDCRKKIHMTLGNDCYQRISKG